MHHFLMIFYWHLLNCATEQPMVPYVLNSNVLLYQHMHWYLAILVDRRTAMLWEATSNIFNNNLHHDAITSSNQYSTNTTNVTTNFTIIFLTSQGKCTFHGTLVELSARHDFLHSLVLSHVLYNQKSFKLQLQWKIDIWLSPRFLGYVGKMRILVNSEEHFGRFLLLLSIKRALAQFWFFQHDNDLFTMKVVHVDQVTHFIWNLMSHLE